MAEITRRQPSPLFFRVANPIFGWMLSNGRGPTDDMMLLHWRGRKSGRAFRTPVSRFELDGRTFTTTSAPWRHNFAGGHPAQLDLDGERRDVIGSLIDDPASVGAAMKAVMDELGAKSAARAMGIRIEGQPTTEDFAAFAAADNNTLVEFTVSE